MGIAENNFDLFQDLPVDDVKMGPLPLGFNESDSTDDKLVATKDAIKRQLRAGRHPVVAVSFGKDSAILLMIAIQALEEVIAEDGSAPTMFAITSNTLLENPEMDMYSRREAKKVRAYAKAKGLPLEMHIASPGVSNNYLVGMIGGRLIASTPDAGRKCTVMMKIAPIERLKKNLGRKMGYKPAEARDKFVTLIGKRYDESEERRRNMAANGERPDEPIKMLQDKAGKKYELVMSPIAAWSLDDIFMGIAMVRNNMIETYSDFEALVDIYKDANEGQCMINVYANGKPGRTACGARTGCHICLAVGDDRSMENMLNDPSKSYMRPLNDFRSLIKRNHYKLDKRNWLARTVNEDGTINVAPNSYSPAHCLDLLRYALTIDADERDAAEVLGIAPRFQLLTVKDIIAIDLLWSRYGTQKGLMACYTARQVENGARWPMPAIDPSEVVPTRLPKERRMTVPFADSEFGHFSHGLFDLEAAVADLDAFDAPLAEEFQVDPEGAALFWDFELDNALARLGPDSAPDWAPATALYYFLRMGTVQLFKGSQSQVSEMLQMSNQIHRHGVRDVLNDPVALISRLGKPGQVLPASGQQIDIDDQIRIARELEAEAAAQPSLVQSYDPSQIIARA